MKTGHNKKIRTANVVSYHPLIDTEVVVNDHLYLMETEIVVAYCDLMT